MRYINKPSNIDYLINHVRFYVDSVGERKLTDEFIRSSIITAVYQLQNKWHHKYMVFFEGFYTECPNSYKVPFGFRCALLNSGIVIIPSGLTDYDVFRNPSIVSYDETGPVILQEDAYTVIMASVVAVILSIYTSSSSSFQIWEDGEYRFSNATSQKALSDTLNFCKSELNSRFKNILSSPKVSNFGRNTPIIM